MNDNCKLDGVFSLLLTPFSHDGGVNWYNYSSYVEWQIKHGAEGVFAVCGSSEMQCLDLDERIRLASEAVKLAGTTPVVATANLGPDRNRHLDEMLRMVETGISACVLVPPDRLASDQDRFAEYVVEMAARAPCPVILYEWPGASPNRISAEVYGQLAGSGYIHGIKDTTCTVEGIAAKVQAAPESTVYQANTPYLLDSIRHGVKGFMAITTTVATTLALEIWNCAIQGDSKSDNLHRDLVFLDSILSRGYPATAKYLISLLGVPFDLTCRTRATLSPETRKALEVWHQSYDLMKWG